MSKLFSPLTIKGITLKNRIVVSPMCQYSSIDGFANDWHFVHLGSRAVGGAGLIIIEATGVSPEARISPEDMGIWKDEHIGKLSQITAFMKQQGAVAGIQLAHAGRKASTNVPWLGRGAVSVADGGWQPVAPAATAYADNYPKPLALDDAGIQKVIGDFRAAAERAIKAGFEVIEIHASHGYLLHQFLSPLTNHRKDAYGGSFENRSRLLLQVFEEVKRVLPHDIPLFVRIPGYDWAEGGWNPEDAVALARVLRDHGADVLDVSSGGLVEHQKIVAGPAYQLPFASKVKREAGIMVSTVGLITNAAQAESILVNGDADLIMMAREFLRDPYFPLRAAHELKENIAWPKQYERGKF
ncbi:NADH:flavin oxidoreductase/NADH oxidase [Pollutibacter soli]|uniref:NADH:flavin oxidoreductase/NADH oxidase n=1 Tax=Pollutibacter soli TaxID=3034157 RepID=UPI003013B7B2